MDTSSLPPVDSASPPLVDPASPPAVNPASPPPFDPLAYAAWLDTIVPLSEGARLRSVSVPALKGAEERRARERGEPSRIMELSVRRRGIRRRHALLLPEPEEEFRSIKPKKRKRSGTTAAAGEAAE
jgi:hypothetical protein